MVSSGLRIFTVRLHCRERPLRATRLLRLFEAGLKPVPMAGLAHSRADGQTRLQGTWIIQAIFSVGQVALRVMDWRQFVGRIRWFQILGQGVEYLFYTAEDCSRTHSVPSPCAWIWLWSPQPARRAQ